MATIRPYTTDDYAGIVAVANAAAPEYPTSVEDLTYGDQSRPAHLHFGRFVLEDDAGNIRGVAAYMQFADLYDPERLWVSNIIHPDHRRQSYGRALYTRLMEAIKQIDGIKGLNANVREDQPGGLVFAERYGFKEVSRRWPARLDLQTANIASFNQAITRVEAQGIRIAPLSELLDAPDSAEKLYHLQTAIDADVPMDEPVTPMAFEQFRGRMVDNPALVKAGTFIALDGDGYIGMSSLFDHGEGVLMIDLTGTLAAYRRRGIAWALKVRGVQFAQENGFAVIATTNDPVNTGMLAINDRLGFERQPAVIKFTRPIHDTTDTL